MFLRSKLTSAVICNGKSVVLKSVGFSNIANKSCCEARWSCLLVDIVHEGYFQIANIVLGLIK